MSDPFESQLAALNAAAELMKQAKEVARLFDAVGMNLPPAIVRMLSDDDRSPRTKVSFQPVIPERPEEANKDWMWVPMEAVSAPALVLACLKEHGGEAEINTVVEYVKKARPALFSGSTYNIGPRLEDQDKITRADGKWKLLPKTETPVIHKGHMWGPPRVFISYDLAAHRRALIEQLLRSETNGLMAMQVMDLLKRSGACKAPMDKHVIKADLTDLARDRKIKRVGNSRKWTAVTAPTKTKGGIKDD
jgi:hypothetical protein